MGKTHRYCGGKGYVRLASGADGHCFGCNGTGKATRQSAQAKAEQAAFQNAWLLLTALRRGGPVAAPEGTPFYSFRSDVVGGFEKLAQAEPQRLPKLYASLSAGRLQSVATALYEYGRPAAVEDPFTTTSYQSLYCMKCHKDSLWTSLRCDRTGSEFIDNGPEQPEGLTSRYEGICLRCCNHNHG